MVPGHRLLINSSVLLFSDLFVLIYFLLSNVIYIGFLKNSLYLFQICNLIFVSEYGCIHIPQF